MLELMTKGGWVMWALLGASVAAVTIMIERAIFYARLRDDGGRALAGFQRAMRDGDRSEALATTESFRGPLGQVLRASLDAWDRGVQDLEEAYAFEANRAADRLESYLGGLSVIAQGAPLLGLLGTVTGMIRAFMEIERLSGEVEVATLAGGIWEALLTTAFGLVVAIPALFAYHFFDSRADRHMSLMRDEGARIVALKKAESAA